MPFVYENAKRGQYGKILQDVRKKLDVSEEELARACTQAGQIIASAQIKLAESGTELTRPESVYAKMFAGLKHLAEEKAIPLPYKDYGSLLNGHDPARKAFRSTFAPLPSEDLTVSSTGLKAALEPAPAQPEQATEKKNTSPNGDYSPKLAAAVRWIRGYENGKSITQDEFARFLGVPKPVLLQLEKDGKIDPETEKKIVAKLGGTMEEVIARARGIAESYDTTFESLYVAGRATAASNGADGRGR